jgi:hypothetical protein
MKLQKVDKMTYKNERKATPKSLICNGLGEKVKKLKYGYPTN